MNARKIDALLAELEGVERWEWEAFRDRVDEKYAADARKMTLTPDMAGHIRQRLADEAGIGESRPREGSRQMKMF